MSRRTLVDPRFPATLRELREARGMSIRELAACAYVSKSTVSELENARFNPSLEMAAHLDRVLHADGELAAMVTAEPGPEPEHEERVQYVMSRPTRLDARTVDALAGVLSAYRRLDDALDAHILLPPSEVQWGTVAHLSKDARGRHASALHRAAAEWTQFVGWLLAEARHDARAAQVLNRAHAEAVELDDGPLAAQAADFRAYLARLRREWRPAARWSLIAADTPGATGLQRAQNLSHAAYALARIGEKREAARLLARARDLTDRDEPQPDTVYWLSPEFIRLGIGLALHGIGDRHGAAEQLQAGLDGLPPGWAEAEWAVEYRQALAEAVQ